MIKSFLKLIVVVSILFVTNTVAAQSTSLQANKKELIFSAVKGTESKPGLITFSSKKSDKISFRISGEKAENFKLVGSVPTQIVANKKTNLTILFKPSDDTIGILEAKLQAVGSSGKLIAETDLKGLSLKGLEGENEPTLKTVIEILGYQVNNGWNTLANNLKPELQGEEIIASSFQKAAKGKVEMIPVARFSPDFELPFGYYITSRNGPILHQVGVLSKTKDKPEHQALFPSISEGTSYFDPGENIFGLYGTGAGHSAYTLDDWNILLHPNNAAHATRTYPLKDKQGKLVSNTYLVCFEEAKNGDYNDYVFILKNVQPVTLSEEYTNLFNGKNLEGWDIFLSGRELNNDTEKNFAVQTDGAVHVKGKELGYIRTKKGFTNYHFSVEFKWGEKKWPPREDAKRDAGVCYNIPDNEPDSIWPKSIECQIQEGDTGDFWLLSFSTITVNDSTNKPANHTRMVKKLDAEKPTGQWNTVEVISYNGKCIHIVNGVVVNAGDKASITNGKILLQSEYSEVYYRNAKIKQL
jgi:hypothetical protein